MTEDESTETGNPRFIKVKPRYISPEAVFNAKYIASTGPVDVVSLATEKQKALEERLNEVGKPPIGILQESVNLASEYVREIYPGANKVIEMPQVQVLDREDVDCIKHEFQLDTDPETAGGFFVQGVNRIYIISDDNLPDYMVAGIIAHEMLHNVFDIQVGVYSLEKGKFLTSFNSESRRFGLSVSRVEVQGGSVKASKQTGVVLNELPNYAYESQFDKVLLAQEKGGVIYGGDIERRTDLIKKEDCLENGYIGLRFRDRGFVNLSERNMHFLKSRELMVNEGILMYQLADDLDALCGEVDGKMLSELLLDAKSNPSIQHIVKRRLDEVMGKGFYRRLKSKPFNFDNVLSILIEAQKHYGEE